jgi:heme exporter protein D
MIWDTWNDFFAMGGYALYVWGSVVAVLGLMLCEVVVLTLRGKSIRQELASTRTSNALHMKGRP